MSRSCLTIGLQLWVVVVGQEPFAVSRSCLTIGLQLRAAVGVLTPYEVLTPCDREPSIAVCRDERDFDRAHQRPSGIKKTTYFISMNQNKFIRIMISRRSCTWRTHGRYDFPVSGVLGQVGPEHCRLRNPPVVAVENTGRPVLGERNSVSWV